MANLNHLAGRNRNQLAQHLPAMLEELNGIRDACLRLTDDPRERWRADQVKLIQRIIQAGDARQLFDAIEVLSGGDYVGPICVAELENILESVRQDGMPSYLINSGALSHHISNDNLFIRLSWLLLHFCLRTRIPDARSQGPPE